MIINKPKIERIGNKVRVSSYIEVEKRKDLSKNLWFEFDKEYEKYISGSLNGFVSAITLFAMYLKEDIKVKGKISPKLEYGLKQFQRYFDYWHNNEFEFPLPKKFYKINIIPEGYKVPEEPRKGVACTFTGGVDSFYTLWKHIPKNVSNPNHKITHCLIIDNGKRPLFDESEDSYDLLKEKYKDLTKRLNIKLITVTTNIEDVFVKELYGPETHAGIILGSGLILDKLFYRFYIPSSFSYSQLIPWGSNPMTDPLLSTEKLDIIHHGCEKTRVEKTIEIAKWEEINDYLRVCWNSIGTKNCGKCSKCIRTMIALHLAGKLSKNNTFLSNLKKNKIRKWDVKGEVKDIFAKELINYAKLNGRKDIAFDIKYAIIRSKILNKIWRISASLKNKSKTYRNFVKLIKK